VIRLGVNIDHVATVRQARLGFVPDPVAAALACERAGADSIVCHLREDRRHIQDRDVARLLTHLAIPLNLEMSMAPDVVEAALRLRPQQVTLVPERRRELTTEGGLDAVRLASRLRRLVGAFHKRGIQVSLFIDPIAAQVQAAADTGARIVELHTGAYANSPTPARRAQALKALGRAARQARTHGLAVAAGHGLDYHHVKAVARIVEIEELNIGFSIIARAVFVGIERAVRQMSALLQRDT
jgi:pyridoxine 5-phosphate synthase